MAPGKSATNRNKHADNVQPLSYDIRLPDEAQADALRGQAERKQVFQLIQPMLSDGFIRPKTEKRPAGKNRKSIKEAIEALQQTFEDDDTAFVTMQNVVEQACNYFLDHGEFPTTYEQMQAINIARLGVAFLTHMQTTGKAQAFSVTEEHSVKPVRYMPTGAVPLFPPQLQITRLLEAGKVYINGWKKSATLRPSYATSLLLRLCG
jgi:hypothetical protein